MADPVGNVVSDDSVTDPADPLPEQDTSSEATKTFSREQVNLHEIRLKERENVVPDYNKLSDESVTYSSSSDESVVTSPLIWEQILNSGQIDYVRTVIQGFEAQGGESSGEFKFLKHLIMQLRAKRIGALEFKRRTIMHLRDHPQFILGINEFLPQELHITDPTAAYTNVECQSDFLLLLEKYFTNHVFVLEDIEDAVDKFEKNPSEFARSRAVKRIEVALEDYPDMAKEWIRLKL